MAFISFIREESVALFLLCAIMPLPKGEREKRQFLLAFLSFLVWHLLPHTLADLDLTIHSPSTTRRTIRSVTLSFD